MKNNLVIAVLGHRHSGKSTTWTTIFEEVVRTGSRERRLFLTPTEYIDVFVVNGSAEERDLDIEDIIPDTLPRIVLCSMQYIDEVTATFNFFLERDYFLYVQWLNPGFNDQNNVAHSDYLGIINKILGLETTVSVRNGKINAVDRVQEITDYLYGWAGTRNLIRTEIS